MLLIDISAKGAVLKTRSFKFFFKVKDAFRRTSIDMKYSIAWSSDEIYGMNDVTHRLRRDQEESLDLYYMYELERHTSEIAAFHLDR